jgi:hypothetical protein
VWDRSSTVPLVRPFLEMDINLCKLHYGKALFSYCAESMQWISVPGTFTGHNNHITACCSSLAHVESGAA